MEYGHPIRVVAKRTGMSPHLIRMWERRYAAVEPHRTSTGRRMYAEDDIERLILLRRATLEGESIGQIARLSKEELRGLIPQNATHPNGDTHLRNSAGIDQHLDLCLQSMRNLDAVGLETRLLRASVDLGQQTFIEKLLHPLLELTGEMWADGRLKVAHEHLASAVVRSLLGSMYVSSGSDANDPLIVSTTPVGQYHEFGALMASVTAATSGWRTLYLGSSLPAEDIVQTATERHADAVALSIVYPTDDPHLPQELRRVRDMLGSGIPLLVGGRSAFAYDAALTDIGSIRIGGLVELRKELTRLKRNIKPFPAAQGS